MNKKQQLSEMMCLDFFIASLSNEEYKKIASKITPSKVKLTPLKSFDFYSYHYLETLKEMKKHTDINTFRVFSKKEKLNNNIDAIFKNQEFEAIVITDLKQKILWVNDGFTDMTGYSKKDALNKTPHFLHGKKTSSTVKKKIRNGLKKSNPFTAVVINYRKDHSLYNCEVKIIPLYNNNKEITHFLALEREVV